MNVIKPNGHEELYCKEGCFLIYNKENVEKCGKGEWKAINYARNITFNDMYIAWLDKDGKYFHEDITGKFLSVFPKNYTKEPEPTEPKEKVPEDRQMSIFDLPEITI